MAAVVVVGGSGLVVAMKTYLALPLSFDADLMDLNSVLHSSTCCVLCSMWFLGKLKYSSNMRCQNLF